MPNWDTMPLSFYVGVTMAIVLVVIAIVVPLLLRRVQRGTTGRALESRDRAQMAEAQHLSELAISASMASVTSAQRQ